MTGSFQSLETLYARKGFFGEYRLNFPSDSHPRIHPFLFGSYTVPLLPVPTRSSRTLGGGSYWRRSSFFGNSPPFPSRDAGGPRSAHSPASPEPRRMGEACTQGRSGALGEEGRPPPSFPSSGRQGRYFPGPGGAERSRTELCGSAGGRGGIGGAGSISRSRASPG